MNANKMKLMYLLMYMAFAVWRVYYNVFLENEGFSGTQIGTLNALMQSTFFVFVPIWGIVADRQGIRPTLLWLVLGSAILVFFLGQITNFWILLFFIPVLTLFHHPLGPLNDALAMQVADADKRYSFGSLRLWGSLGWAVASVIGGYVFVHIPVKYVFPVSTGLFLILAPFLITYKRKTIYKPNFQAISLKEFISNKPILFFIVILTLYGISCSPINSFLNLYFKELNGGNNIIGYAYAIVAFSELPFFLLGNRILLRMGARVVIAIAIGAMVLRMALYALAPNIYIALAIGALQGITLSFFLVGAVAFLSKLMPAGREATSQSIIWTTYTGVGQSVGNLIIGPMIDNAGMVGVMKIFTLINLVVLLFTLAYFKVVKSWLKQDSV